MAVTTREERRIVTALIADVVGSTAIGEQLGPERSKLLIDEVVRLMAEQVRRYEGTVAQLVGDEMLAFFGAPVSHEDDSERAVRAALAIQRAVQSYAQEVKDAYGIELAVRIGINTGPVVVGMEADGDGDPWNALGDTVNVAARLQNIAPEGGIVIGPTTERQIEDYFEVEELETPELKGISKKLRIYKIVGSREMEHPEPAHAIVGRDFELSVLERVMEGLVEGRGAIVSVMGEPGIGKSRLVWEVRSRYRDRVRFIEGRSVSYAQTFPYWPIRDLLREWLGVGASTPEARVRLELKAQLAELFGEESEEVYPFFANLLNLTLEPDAAQRIRELNRESIQTATFEAFYEFICKLAEEQPIGLVFEDLHWADESTLELIESLLGVTEESSVALFLLYRTEREHGVWSLGERARQRYPHRTREVEVRPLPADASRSLATLSAEGELPETVTDHLAQRSGGNPFFLEEALRDLVERGALVKQNGKWEMAVTEDELAIPALVQGALQARLDRLEPPTREVLSFAAVIGRTFGLPLLEKLVPREQLQPALTELQRLDLIVEVRRRPNPEYRFRHGLVQEVAYASLVETTRKKLHKRVGEALEEIYRESPEESYALLARHFSEADVPDKAVDYLLKAGDRARSIYADQEALEHYRKARTFLGQLGDEARARDTLFKMALTYHLAFDFENAEEMYDEAFSCRVDEETRHEPTEHLSTAVSKPDAVVPGHVYSTEGLKITEQLFKGLLMIDDELNVLPSMADNMRVSSDGLTYLFRLREGRALERRRAADGRRLRLHVDAHARARDPHLVPHGGRRDRGGPRRPHARDHAARAAQLLPLRPRLAVGLPLAPAPLRAARGGLAPAREHRLQRPVHTGRVRRRARAPDGKSVLERAARERPRDRDPVHRDEPGDDRALDERRVRRRHGLEPGDHGRPRHALRAHPRPAHALRRLLGRQAAVLEQARPQGVRARGQPRGAPTRCGQRARLDPRRCDPAGDARPLPPRRARVRPGDRAPAARRSGLSGGPRPPRAAGCSSRPGSCRPRSSSPSRSPRSGSASTTARRTGSSGRRASRTSISGSAASAPTTPTRTVSSAGSSASPSRSTGTTRSRRRSSRPGRSATSPSA